MVFAFPDPETAAEPTEREREALAALDYAAMEQPATFVDEVRAAFRLFR
jgi:hypothetical protein